MAAWDLFVKRTETITEAPGFLRVYTDQIESREQNPKPQVSQFVLQLLVPVTHTSKGDVEGFLKLITHKINKK